MSIKAGASKVNITPDLKRKAVCLNGYTDRKKRPAQGVLDEVFARALVLEDDSGNLLGIVSADLCWFSSELRDEILKRLEPEGFSAHNLVLAATHTHSSFFGYDRSFLAQKLFGPFDEEILTETASKVAQAVLQAKRNMQDARAAMAVRRVEGLTRSRLDPAFQFGADESKPEVEPDPEKYPVDDDMTVLHISAQDGSTIAAVIHLAAHPTILSPKNMKISADFPGVLCGKLEKSLGDDAIAMFLNGTLGDTAPLPDWTSSLDAEIKDMMEYGEKLAQIATEVLERAAPLENAQIAGSAVEIKAPRIVLRRLGNIKLPRILSRLFYSKEQIPFQAVRLGSLVFLAIPGEPTTDVGERLKGMCSEDSRCLVVAPANGYVGYIVTPEQYDDGGYASDTCFFGRNASDIVADAVRKALAKLS